MTNAIKEAGARIEFIGSGLSIDYILIDFVTRTEQALHLHLLVAQFCLVPASHDLFFDC